MTLAWYIWYQNGFAKCRKQIGSLQSCTCQLWGKPQHVSRTETSTIMLRMWIWGCRNRVWLTSLFIETLLDTRSTPCVSSKNWRAHQTIRRHLWNSTTQNVDDTMIKYKTEQIQRCHFFVAYPEIFDYERAQLLTTNLHIMSSHSYVKKTRTNATSTYSRCNRCFRRFW